jgi:mevalonate kinase
MKPYIMARTICPQFVFSRARDAATTPSLDIVNAHAYAAEVLLHNDPSGVDNTIATYGGAIVFRKIPSHYMETFPLPSSLRILLTNTHVSRETKTLVAGVRQLYQAEYLLNRYGDIYMSVCVHDDQVKLNELTEKDLACMLEKNQMSLEALQVSHDSIRTICKTTTAFGMATKLTGAGNTFSTCVPLCLLFQSIEFRILDTT